MGDSSQGYQFEQAARFDKGYGGLEPLSDLEPLRRVIGAYRARMERVSDLGEMPAMLVFFAGHFADIKIRSIQEVKRLGLEPLEKAAWAYQQTEFKRWRNRPEAELDQEIREVGASNLETMIADSETTIKPGIEATLASMLSDAWSAFEILAGDLWIEAVNACPDMLARKYGDKQVKLEALRSFDYDISKEMGRFLVEPGKVEFLSLSSIRGAYATAFDTGEAQPSQHLFVPFSVLDGIGQIRHCFAHRGGIIDQRGLKLIQCVAGLETAKAGDRVPITGPIVRESISSLVGCAVRLFRFVDEWLCDHSCQCKRRLERRSRTVGEG